ncbi:MAG: clan AA aspartic protease [Bacteroidetes bacterium]|nr:clan AA aspartic protease [Bacteroidota bacterium]
MKPMISLLLILTFVTISFGQTLKFQYYQSLIFIPVRVNNYDLLFLLNTGANASVIDNNVATRLKISASSKQDSVIGTAGKERVQIVTLALFKIGNSTLKNVVVTSRTLHHFIALNGKKVDGILGTDLLKLFAITIDFKEQKIVFQNAGIPAGRKKTILFEMPEGIPKVSVKLNDTFQTYLHYNSGVSMEFDKSVYVNLSPTQWNSLHSKESDISEHKNLWGQGVGGNVLLKTVKLNSVVLSNQLRLPFVYAVLQPSEGYFESKKSIGFFSNNLLEKSGRISVDFINKQIVLPFSKN